MKIIVGLGNPGKKYAESRHNVGFKCVDLLAEKINIKLSDRRTKASMGQGSIGEHQVVLAKLRTFMNHSGEGVSYLLTRFNTRPEDLIVVYDEMALPLGRLRIRRGGSDAGHNGIGSIIHELHTHEFPRVRVGIGRAPQDQDEIRHVLGTFSPAEKPLIQRSVNTVSNALVFILEHDMEEAMNRFNRADPELTESRPLDSHPPC